MCKPEILISLLLISTGCLVHRTQGFGLNDVLDITYIAKNIVLVIAKSWNIVESHIDFGEVPIPLLDRTEHKLFGKIGIINAKVDQIAQQIDTTGSSTISTIIRSIPERVRLELRLNDLLDYITRMNVMHRSFQNYVNKSNDFERLTLEDFARTAISHDSNSVNNLIERIHAFIESESRSIGDTGLMGLLQKSLQEVEGDMLCNSKQSPQQVLYNLYRTIALTELKGYMMIQFSYMLLRLYDHGNFTTESQVMRERFEERTNRALEIVKQSMQSSSRELWKCDPKKHEQGETYVEVTQLLQGYVQNEVDLNHEGTCRENCAEYSYTKSHGCYKNLFCRQQRRCNGKILNCQFFDSDMWICPADPSTGRRYEYIEYENGRVLGRRQGCRRGTTKVDSWWRYLFWHCSYCFCFCDDQGSNSDRYFNLRPAIADIHKNKVVTGVKFTKENRIIHLQIQEGELGPRGSIKNGTLRWVPVEDYKITDRNIYNGKDYHTLSSEKRAIDLDNLEAEDEHVLTGMRFKTIGGHLNLEIYVTKFDFDTGKLVNPNATSKWVDNPNTDVSLNNPRKKLNLVHPDIPTRSPLPSIPDSKSDQYIEFTHSDIDRDVAQTTVPFLDAQEVVPMEPTPLTGAGIFHKGRNNFGGFIAPKVMTLDFSKYMRAAFPEEDVN